MNKLLLLCNMVLLAGLTASAQSVPAPKMPVQMPAATAQGFINTYKSTIPNFFAHGYLLDINKAKTMSATGIRIYNGFSGTEMMMVATPLDAAYKTNMGGACYMNSDQRLCPRICDIATPEEGAQILGAQVATLVNTCIECKKFEAVNAMIVFTPVLNNLAGAGFDMVRLYNGMDANSKRYVVYVPVDGEGSEIMTDNLYVGDYTNVLTNCKYP